MKFNRTQQAHFALLAVQLIYGINYLVAKGIMPDKIGPSAFVMLRLSAGGLLFWLVSSFFKEKVDRRDLPKLALCGLLGACANQMLFFNGLNLTSPIDAAIIMTSTPVFVLIISSFILKESITFQKVVGLIVGAIGAILLIYAGATSRGTGTILGNSLVLMNAVSFSFYLVIVKPFMKKYKPITVISWVFLFGFLFGLPFGAKQLYETDFSTFTSGTYAVIAFVILGTTFLAYLFNIFASKHVMPSISGSYIYLQPVISFLVVSIYSFWMKVDRYKDDISMLKVACCLFVIAGVYLISSKRLKLFQIRSKSSQV
ncbi:MAG: EamA/RhaT family transporter [Bacteroidetes bacterium]|nr:MAG: EamA/RhaT family transporter [Bacteroidota bacterium]